MIIDHPITMTKSFIRYAGMHGYNGNNEVIRSNLIFTGFSSEYSGYGRLDKTYIYRSYVQSFNPPRIDVVATEDSVNVYFMIIGQ